MPTPAENYEAFMVPPFFAPWADALAARARPAPGAAILDVGCGTGIVARRLAAADGAGRIVGLDATPAMLDGGARRRRPRGTRHRMARGRRRAPAVRRRRVRPRHLPVRADVLHRPRRSARRDGAGAASRRPALPSACFQPIGAPSVLRGARPGDPRPPRRLRGRADLRPRRRRRPARRRSKPPASTTSPSRKPPWTPASPTRPASSPARSRSTPPRSRRCRRSVPTPGASSSPALEQEMSGPLAAVTRGGEVVMPFHVLIADRPPDLKAASLPPQRPRQQRLHRALRASPCRRARRRPPRRSAARRRARRRAGRRRGRSPPPRRCRRGGASPAPRARPRAKLRDWAELQVSDRSPRPGEAGERLRPRAHGDGEPGHLGEAAGHQRRPRRGAEAAALGHAAGDGDDVLERAAELGADHVVGQVEPEPPRREPRLQLAGRARGRRRRG